MNSLSAEKVQNKCHQERRRRSQYRSRQRLVNRPVDHRTRQDGTFTEIFTNTVEQDNSIVERKANHR